MWAMRIEVAVLAGLLVASAAGADDRSASLTDDQVAERLISESIARYPGNCPCPYHHASNGSRCGGRSAYSRGGGAAPLCYREDVTPAMIEAFRKRGQS